jgi:hypothetical protein
MGQITAWQCDGCHNIIHPAKDSKNGINGINGYIVEGSIFIAEGDGNSGLIGSGKPVMRDGKLTRSVFCHDCFCKALHIKALSIGTIFNLDGLPEEVLP